MSDFFSSLQEVDDKPQPGDFFDSMTGGAAQPQAPSQVSTGIDFSQPIPNVRAAINKLPKEQRKAALNEWAKAYVQREQKGRNPVARAADRVVRTLARGTPVGSWLDEANAATQAGLYSIGLGGAPYEETLAYQRARDRYADENSTKLGTLPLIGDVTAGGATKLVGGMASFGAGSVLANAGARAAAAPFGMIPRVKAGKELLPQFINGVVGGFGYGALYGSGEGDTIRDRAANAGVGAGIGLAMGGVGPFISRGLGTGYEFVKSRTQPRPGVLGNYDPGAVSRVSRAFGDDNLPRNYPAEAARLGPEGMLADMGTNLQGQAGAIANAPGRGKTIVEGALRSRDRLGRQRIDQLANETLGPTRQTIQVGSRPPQTYQNGEALTRGVKSETQAAAAPIYRQFYETPVQRTPEIRQVIERAEALIPKVLDEARDLMRADGLPQNIRANNGALFDYVKKALDAYVTRFADKDPNRARIAGNVARDLVRAIDDQLGGPQNSIYATAREVAGQGLQFKEGFDAGKKMFAGTSTTAETIRHDISRSAPWVQEGRRAGGREYLRNQMAQARTAFDTQAERAASAGRQALSSGETRAKIGAVYGPDVARTLSRGMDAEGRFANTSNKILGNSATAGRIEARKEFPGEVTRDVVANEFGKKSLTGLGMEAAVRTMNFLTAGAMNERRRQVAIDAAEMLVARGQTRENIARALMQIANRRNITAARREYIEGLATQVMQGSRGATIGSSEFIAR